MSLARILAVLIVCACANAEDAKPPAFSEIFSVNLPRNWELAEEGWKSGETGGEMLFSIEPGPEPYVKVMGHVVWGEVIEPIYDDRTLIDETDEYQLYDVTRSIDQKRFLVWLKEGEKYTLTLWLEPEEAELNQRVLAAFGPVEVH